MKRNIKTHKIGGYSDHQVAWDKKEALKKQGYLAEILCSKNKQGDYVYRIKCSLYTVAQMQANPSIAKKTN